jgi:hypothetical protein
MVDASRIGKLLEALASGIAAHDRSHPDHNAWGIGMAAFDIERLGLEEGEEILPGIVLQADGGQPGAFRILCDGLHDEEQEEEEEEEIVEAFGVEEETAKPVYAPGPGIPSGPGVPPKIRPPV